MLADYGEKFHDFIRLFPTISNRSDIIFSVEDAVNREGLNLVQIDNSVGGSVTEFWLKVMLTELMIYLGAFDVVKPLQIKGIAARIRNEYFYLTPSELTHFFYAFSMGDYGKLYAGRSVNPQDIMIALKKYNTEVMLQRQNHYNELLIKKGEEEMAEARRNAIPFDEWKRRHNKPDDYQIPIYKPNTINDTDTQRHGQQPDKACTDTSCKD